MTDTEFKPVKYAFIDEWGKRDGDLAIEWRGLGAWAVTSNLGCYSKDGEWEYEPQESDRDQAFMNRCRFSLQEATQVALNIRNKTSEVSK